MATNIYGTTGNDDIIGTYGADNIYAGSGNDWINGRIGADYMYGAAGDDVFWWDVIDTDGFAQPFGLISGGIGYDLIDMSNFNLSDLIYDDADAIVWAGDQAYDFDSIEEIWLSNARNVIDTPLGITAATSPLGIFMGGGDDFAALAGAVTVNGEAGNDMFRLTGVINAGFTVNATVIGGLGVDTIRLDDGFTVDLFEGYADAGDSRYFIEGIENIQGVARANEAEATIAYGNDLANRMTVWSDTSTLTSLGVDFFGYGGNDYLSGSRAQDLLEGGAGNDALYGLTGADTLRGGLGADRMFGGAGADYLEGGAGKDTLWGGAGADDFTFLALTDSRTLAAADTIADFRHAEFDLIDLAAIDAIAGGANNAFTFIGNAAFNGTAGQLRYAFDGSGSTIVSADVNGDRVADFVLRLSGEHSLVSGDFVL